MDIFQKNKHKKSSLYQNIKNFFSDATQKLLVMDIHYITNQCIKNHIISFSSNAISICSIRNATGG